MEAVMVITCEFLTEVTGYLLHLLVVSGRAECVTDSAVSGFQLLGVAFTNVSQVCMQQHKIDVLHNSESSIKP